MESQTNMVRETVPTSEDSWSLPTRLLHLGLVVAVTGQLLLSLVMTPPDEKQPSAIGSATFEIHEVLGIVALMIVLLHWLWTVIKQADGGWRHLFPWFGEARAEVIDELKALLGGRLPEGGARGGLPGFIHGLGLLVVSGMAVTGGMLFVLLPETGKPGPWAELLAEIHETLSGVMWAYWVGHGGMAVLHHYTGHTTLRNMFRFRR